MHTIEPHFHWRQEYTAEEDEKSPFFGREYDEFGFPNQIYNYLIHPQWDEFESETLYVKLLMVDYEQTYVVIEMIGEWNDCLHNDIAILKRNVLDVLIENGIYKYILIGENVLNFHASDDCYYEEWSSELNEEEGWICLVNMLDHVWDEMQETGLNNFMYFGEDFNNVIWRPNKPQQLFWDIEQRIEDHNKERIYI